ncbi:diaminobutyrate acetyltransferase [Cellulomonas bogoriensis]|uniref:L-2,4-diaminobutyric acid acetyltransferase n=1 Tax=Cellulomonas bogoriensis 69B4 = DSM 16987 TaxID=1386082 RepID=A0A0A0BXZ3_9CELL|nr:diaminobutyrate acetyltransferase [Cellulomonas bogoriensis]KGM13228.1 2,4-diaminobutyric acid acetyltransferase [Cellulomonas bogoriensis 69B4 = DSM 16987]
MRPETTTTDTDDTDSETVISRPTMSDGAVMWRVARDSRTLDLNSSYSYLLFCHDFAETCRIATVGGEPAGFVLGYRRPTRPDHLFVWQVAVDQAHRGRGVSSRLLDSLVHDVDPASGLPPVRFVETTITDDNTASRALFAAFARRWGTGLEEVPLMTAAHFPDGHDAEPLHRIGPFAPEQAG